MHLGKRVDAPPATVVTNPLWAPGEEPIRPDIFGSAGDEEVQLDDGVYVTWDEIRPYYLTVASAGSQGVPSDSPDTSSGVSNDTVTG